MFERFSGNRSAKGQSLFVAKVTRNSTLTQLIVFGGTVVLDQGELEYYAVKPARNGRARALYDGGLHVCCVRLTLMQQ